MPLERDMRLIGNATDAERDRICRIIRQWGLKHECPEEANLLVDEIRGVRPSDDHREPEF